MGARGQKRQQVVTDHKRTKEDRAAHVWFLECMDRINRAMQGTNDLEEMMSAVLDAVLEIFACDRAWLVYPCDPHGTTWRAVMEHTRPEFPGAFALHTDLPIDSEVAAVFAAARACNGVLLLGPAYDLTVPAQLAYRFAIRSLMAMAIYPKVDEPYLFGLHECSVPRAWTAQEERLFQEIGRRLTDSLTSLLIFRSLQESERRLEAAQRIARIGWWERDFRTNHVSLSDEVCRAFGVQPVDLPQWQERWVNLIHPDDRARTAEAAAAALRGGPRYDVEYRVIRPDGTLRVVHSQGDVTCDESGTPLRQFGVLQDITERRQSQDELSDIKERFHVLAESSLTGIYLAEKDYFSYVNPAMARMFGYAVEEIVGRLGPLDLTCPDDRSIVAENMRRRFEGELEEVRYELRGLRKDGSVFPIEVHGRRIEHDGKVGVLGTLVDNTERKRAEDELRASEARFRTFVDHATDGFFLHDENVIVIDVNRQACESLGYSRDELIGMHPREFDAGLDEQSFARLEMRIRGGATVTFETVHRRKDGSVFPVEIRVRNFQQGPRRLHLAVVRDITERKRAEKRRLTQHTVEQILAEAATAEEAEPRILQAICECLDWDLGTLWRVDRAAGVLRCAQLWRKPSLDVPRFEAATRAMTYEPGGGLPGRVWASHIPICIADVVPKPHFRRAAFAMQEGLHAAFAFPILLGAEVLGVIEFVNRQVRQPDQELADAMASLGSQIGQFIERKRAEEALRLAQSELAHVARVMTMGELTASIAHEVNQPLVGMVTSASSCSRWLAAKPPNLKRAQRALERIVLAGTRASAVIDRVRRQVRREPLRIEPVDVNQMVREVIAMTRSELQRSSVSLKTRLAEDLPSILADRIQLQQVVLNLILNAIDAMREIEDGHRQVWITSRLDRGGDLYVEVRDSGIGIGPELRKRLFEAFYTTKKSGLGMGLSISKSIVEAHGGRMAAVANRPRGATFQFWLPLVSEESGVSVRRRGGPLAPGTLIRNNSSA